MQNYYRRWQTWQIWQKLREVVVLLIDAIAKQYHLFATPAMKLPLAMIAEVLNRQRFLALVAAFASFATCLNS